MIICGCCDGTGDDRRGHKCTACDGLGVDLQAEQERESKMEEVLDGFQ